MLTHARADELETTNIQSLAVGFGCYEQAPFRVLGLDAPFFSGLRELIVVAKEVAEAERIRVLEGRSLAMQRGRGRASGASESQAPRCAVSSGDGDDTGHVTAEHGAN
jgi:hypothetical protein